MKLCHDKTWVTMMFHEAREHLTELMNAVGETDTPTLSYWVEKFMSSTRRLFADHVRKELPFFTFRFFGGVEGQKKISEEALLRFTKRATASMKSLMASGAGGSSNTPTRPFSRQDGPPRRVSTQASKREAPMNRKRRQLDRANSTRPMPPPAPKRKDFGPANNSMGAKLRVVNQMGFPSIGAYVAKHNGDLRKMNKDLTCPWKGCTPPQDCNDSRCRACNKPSM